MSRTLTSSRHVVHHASEGDKFNADTTLHVVSCPTCSITYAIPQSLYRSAQKWTGDRPNGWKIVCPLGHEWWYTGQNEEERLREQVRDQREFAGRLAAERDQALADARAQKAAKTRIRNSRERERQRTAAGVCPCCNRTFKQLARHMDRQHPDWPKGSDE